MCYEENLNSDEHRRGKAQIPVKNLKNSVAQA